MANYKPALTTKQAKRGVAQLPQLASGRSIPPVEHYLRSILAAGAITAAMAGVSCGSSDSNNDNPGTTGGSGNSGGNATTGGSKPTGPACMPTDKTEASCTDGKDADCDGFTDCLDTDCDGQSCGDGLSCLA